MRTDTRSSTRTHTHTVAVHFSYYTHVHSFIPTMHVDGKRTNSDLVRHFEK